MGSVEFGSMHPPEDPSGAGPGLAWQQSDALQAHRDRRRVLIVDDQQLIADSLSEILNNAGFEAQAAYDGWDALEIARRFQPDWLLSDVLMPRMNGVELAIAFRTNHPATTVLLFSGQAGISDILQDGKSRGYEFELIAKPIHPLRIVERLSEKE